MFRYCPYISKFTNIFSLFSGGSRLGDCRHGARQNVSLGVRGRGCGGQFYDSHGVSIFVWPDTADRQPHHDHRRRHAPASDINIFRHKAPVCSKNVKKLPLLKTCWDFCWSQWFNRRDSAHLSSSNSRHISGELQQTAPTSPSSHKNK